MLDAPVEIRQFTQTRRIHPETRFICFVVSLLFDVHLHRDLDHSDLCLGSLITWTEFELVWKCFFELMNSTCMSFSELQSCVTQLLSPLDYYLYWITRHGKLWVIRCRLFQDSGKFFDFAESEGEIVWHGLPCKRIFITSGLFIGFLID